MSRICARPDCHHSAVATMSYDYSARTAWLDRLSPESHPMTHDMCGRHATGLSVPYGWRLEDRRTVATLLPRREIRAS